MTSAAGLYVHKDANGEPETIIFAYADTLLVACRSPTAARDLAFTLSPLWPVSNRGPVYSYLGLKFEHDASTRQTFISQPDYIDKLVEDFSECKVLKARKVPIKLSDGAYEKPARDADLQKFRSLVGRLLWIAKSTRPDIAYAVSILSRFKTRPTHKQWMDALGIVSYLKNTRDHALAYGSDPEAAPDIVAWCNGGRLEAANESLFTKGIIVLFLGCPIAWSSVKSAEARCVCDVRFMAEGEGATEIMCQRAILVELGVPVDDGLVMSWCRHGIDAHEYDKTRGPGKPLPKAVLVQNAILEQHITDGDIELVELHDESQASGGCLADLVTCPGDTLRHRLLCEKIGLVDRAST